MTAAMQTATQADHTYRRDERAGGASMRAYVIQEPFGVDALAPVERPVPEPAPGQVVVRMRAVALNYRDLLIVNGAWKAPEPRVPASDGVGEVAAVGPGVTRVRVGDRVAAAFYPRWIEGEATPEKLATPLGGVVADGVLAEYVALDAEGVVHVPAHLSDEEAATLGCAGVTAWHAVARRARVRPGDTVLVQGTGGVSLFALRARGSPAPASSSRRAATRSCGVPARSAPRRGSTTATCRTGTGALWSSPTGAASTTSWRSSAART
jgi:NADPH:quinone reductase-like Zn-dependent oxidoreductase